MSYARGCFVTVGLVLLLACPRPAWGESRMYYSSSFVIGSFSAPDPLGLAGATVNVQTVFSTEGATPVSNAAGDGWATRWLDTSSTTITVNGSASADGVYHVPGTGDLWSFADNSSFGDYSQRPPMVLTIGGNLMQLNLPPVNVPSTTNNPVPPPPAPVTPFPYKNHQVVNEQDGDVRYIEPLSIANTRLPIDSAMPFPQPGERPFVQYTGSVKVGNIADTLGLSGARIDYDFSWTSQGKSPAFDGPNVASGGWTTSWGQENPIGMIRIVGSTSADGVYPAAALASGPWSFHGNGGAGQSVDIPTFEVTIGTTALDVALPGPTLASPVATNASGNTIYPFGYTTADVASWSNGQVLEFSTSGFAQGDVSALTGSAFVVPEPAGLTLLALCALGLVLRRRRRDD